MTRSGLREATDLNFGSLGSVEALPGVVGLSSAADGGCCIAIAALYSLNGISPDWAIPMATVTGFTGTADVSVTALSAPNVAPGKNAVGAVPGIAHDWPPAESGKS